MQNFQRQIPSKIYNLNRWQYPYLPGVAISSKWEDYKEKLQWNTDGH